MDFICSVLRMNFSSPQFFFSDGNGARIIGMRNLNIMSDFRQSNRLNVQPKCVFHSYVKKKEKHKRIHRHVHQTHLEYNGKKRWFVSSTHWSNRALTSSLPTPEQDSESKGAKSESNRIEWEWKEKTLKENVNKRDERAESNTVLWTLNIEQYAFRTTKDNTCQIFLCIVWFLLVLLLSLSLLLFFFFLVHWTFSTFSVIEMAHSFFASVCRSGFYFHSLRNGFAISILYRTDIPVKCLLLLMFRFFLCCWTLLIFL